MNTVDFNPNIAMASESHFASIVTAFAADPAARWLYPDTAQYLNHFPKFAKAFAGLAVAHGTVDRINEFSAAAFWLPPGVQPDDAAVGEILQRSVAQDHLPEVFSLLEQMGNFHPHEPHWYLPMIGVDPAQQGQGCGTALLRKGLARCDQDQLPAYLESTNSKNIPLYERFGFQTVGQIKTKTSPALIPMLRQPQQPKPLVQ